MSTDCNKHLRSAPISITYLPPALLVMIWNSVDEEAEADQTRDQWA